MDRLGFLLAILWLAVIVADTVDAITIEELDNGSWLAKPSGPGPFPAVLYNHGGFGVNVGGDLAATALGLAEAGYIGYSKRRDITSLSLSDSFDDVLDGVTELLGVSEVDSERLGIMGFSRGALLSLRVAQMQPAHFDAVVMMAPAPGKTFPDGSTTMDQYLMGENLDLISDVSVFLVMVANNDVDETVDHVSIAENVYETLLNHPVNVDEHKFQDYYDLAGICPPTDPVGHCLFQSPEQGGQTLLDQEGYYWKYVLAHFEAELRVLPADFNQDQQVDPTDFAILAGNWLTASGRSGGDANGDDFVDPTDFAILSGNWLLGTANAFENQLSLVPEPSTFLLAMLFLVGFGFRNSF